MASKGRKRQDTYEALGMMIRAKRKAQKLSCKALCIKLGRPDDIHKVYALEMGEYQARLHFLEELIFVLGFTAEDLNSIGFKEKFDHMPVAKDVLKDLLGAL